MTFPFLEGRQPSRQIYSDLAKALTTIVKYIEEPAFNRNLLETATDFAYSSSLPEENEAVDFFNELQQRFGSLSKLARIAEKIISQTGFNSGFVESYYEVKTFFQKRQVQLDMAAYRKPYYELPAPTQPKL